MRDKINMSEDVDALACQQRLSWEAGEALYSNFQLTMLRINELRASYYKCVREKKRSILILPMSYNPRTLGY